MGKSSRWITGEGERSVEERRMGKSSLCKSSGKPKQICIKAGVMEDIGEKKRGSNVLRHCISIGRMDPPATASNNRCVICKNVRFEVK